MSIATKALFAVWLLTSFGAAASEVEPVAAGPSADAVLCDGVASGPGQWKTRRVQLLAERNTLQFRDYEAFDPEPARALEFLWTPKAGAGDRGGRIAGEGTLVWRDRAHVAWDAAGVVKTYTGFMRDGRPEGAGEFVNSSGLAYRGVFHDGRPNGSGELLLPSGEIYIGSFLSGCAQGLGRFIDTTGETFDGAFRAGVRNGAGKTTLPNGFAYESAWIAGAEVEGSRRIRVAQLGGGGALPGADLRIGVTVQRTPELPEGVRLREVLTYMSRPTASGIAVEPADKELLAAWKGNGSILVLNSGSDLHNGIFNYDQSFLKSTVPTFLVDVQNKTSRRIEIASFRVEVSESRPDNQPAVEMLDNNDTSCGPRYSTDFDLRNFGWSTAKNARIRYAFKLPNVPADPAATGEFPVGDIVRTKKVDFDGVIRKFGVETARLKALADHLTQTGVMFPCPSGKLQQCLEGLRHDRLFGSLGPALSLHDERIMLNAEGALEYEWSDDLGQSHTRASPYQISMEIGHFTVLAECGEGPTPVPIQHSPLHLRLSGSNYTIAAPFHGAVEAGQFARYTLRVEADQSSTHQFTFVAVLADGSEIKSRPVSLLFFKPRPLPRT